MPTPMGCYYRPQTNVGYYPVAVNSGALTQNGTYDVWYLWQEQQVSPWRAWTTGTASVTLNVASTNPQVWNQWVRQTYANHYTYVSQPTPEQIAAERHRREEYERTHRAARARARCLLEQVLTTEQKAQLDREGRFHVTGSRGRRYCIHARGHSGNVELLDAQGRFVGRFCAHPGDSLPDEDHWLAQMLAIETDEDGFLATANLHNGQYPPDFDRHQAKPRRLAAAA